MLVDGIGTPGGFGGEFAVGERGIFIILAPAPALLPGMSLLVEFGREAGEGRGFGDQAGGLNGRRELVDAFDSEVLGKAADQVLEDVDGGVVVGAEWH